MHACVRAHRRYSALLLRTVERMLEKVAHPHGTQPHAHIHHIARPHAQTVARRPFVSDLLGERQIKAKATQLKASL